jgi:hypothetical protein
MNEFYIGISGVIETDLSHEDFLEQFIEWIEDSDFRFCGSTQYVDENGHPIKSDKKYTTIE